MNLRESSSGSKHNTSQIRSVPKVDGEVPTALGSALIRRLLDRVSRPILSRLAESARFSPAIAMPKFASRHLRDRYPQLALEPEQRRRSAVAYFHGCAANYFDDGVGDAVIAVLRKHGVEPDLPPQRCSGTPIETYGHRELAKEGARMNLRSFTGYETIVTGCASCTLMLKDYPKLFAGEPEQSAAEALASRVTHISEFVAQSPVKPPMAAAGAARKVTYHSSCHLRAAGVTKEPRAILQNLPGVRLCRDAGCRSLCGRSRDLPRQRFRDIAADCGAQTASGRTERRRRRGDQLSGLHDSAQDRLAGRRGK